VLVPTGPGELVRAVVASTTAMAERAGTPFRYILNRTVFRSRLAGRAVAALGEGGRLLGAPVHQRVAIAGRSVWRRLTTLYGGSSYDPRRAGDGPAPDPQDVNQHAIGTPLRPPIGP
jgi:hypothetical protein